MTLLLITLVGVVTAFGLCGYGFNSFTRHGVRRPGADGVLRGTAALLGAAAVGVYALSALGVALQVMDAEDGGTDSAPLRPCSTGVHEREEQVIGYSVRYVPMNFVCRIKGGGSYTAGIPGYFGPATAGAALAAVACAIAAARMREVREVRERHESAKSAKSAVPEDSPGS